MKFLNYIIIEGNVTYLGVKLIRFYAVKQSLQNNVLSHVEEIFIVPDRR